MRAILRLACEVVQSKQIDRRTRQGRDIDRLATEVIKLDAKVTELMHWHAIRQKEQP